jgi:hypothetical protein
MNRRQRERKRLKAQLHQRRLREQFHRDNTEAIEVAMWEGARGRLKKPRDGKEFDKRFQREMEQRDWVPNGRGGWRRKHKSAVVTDSISKEG